MTPDLPKILADALAPDAPRRVGVAVSGGGDSTALLLAAVQAGFGVQAVTVDHHLRPESRAEAEGVAALCARLGVAHDILDWDGASATGNVYDAGRRARFALIGAWARAEGLGDVLLGHTADDEAETFLMRVARSSGLEGLSGMRPRFEEAGVIWHRPLLSVGRAALRDWLRGQGAGWFDDPSNEDTAHARVRVRHALAALAPTGVTAETISRTVAHLAEANRALDAILARWCDVHLSEAGGEISVPFAGFCTLDPELRRRLIGRALNWIAGADYPPRAAKLEALLARLNPDAAPLRATLHGCRVALSRGRLSLTREAAAIAALRVPVAAGTALWDGWAVCAPEGAGDGCHVAALGTALPKEAGRDPAGPGRAALRVSPAIWRGETLISAPLAGLSAGWTVRNCRGSFILREFRR